MSRFDDPDRAKGKLAFECNPFTGKWNFHPSKGTAEEMFENFEYCLRHLLGKPASFPRHWGP